MWIQSKTKPMKNMIVTVPSREHSSTLKIALHTWVRGEWTEHPLCGHLAQVKQLWPWSRTCLKLSQSLLFLYMTETEDRRATSHVALLQRNWSLNGRGSAHPAHNKHLPALVSKSIYCAILHWKQTMALCSVTKRLAQTYWEKWNLPFCFLLKAWHQCVSRKTWTCFWR